MHSSKKNISLFLVLLVAFIDYMGIGLVYPMFSSMVFHKEFALLPVGTSDSMRGLYLGVLLAAMPIVQFFSAPILGTFSDQKGRKKLLVVSLALGVVGYLLSSLSVMFTSILCLIFSRVIVGVSAGSVAVVAASIADVSTTENKAKNFGLYGMACGVGFTVGPFLGGILSEYSPFGIPGFALPFFVSGLVTLINLVLVYFWFQETHTKWIVKKVTLGMGLLNLKKAFELKNIRIVILCVFIFCFGWSFFYEFAPVTWIANYNITASSLGMLYAYAALFYALSSGIFIRPIVKRFAEGAVFFYGLLLTGLYILLLLNTPTYFWLWMYLPFLNFFVSLLFPTATTLVSNHADEKMQGEILGILQSVQSAAFALSPLTSGSCLGISLNMPIIIGGISMLIAALIMGIGMRKYIFSKKALK